MIAGFLIFLLYLLIILIGDFREKRTKLPASLHTAVPCVDATDIIYDGATKKVSIAEIESILEKHCAYYSSLQKDLKERFLKRTDSFISNKIFIVKSSEGYKEMPVLVSAAAVQLTFGLKDYLLPFYKYICIHPREYFGNESFKILAGNVQNNVITIAWNQFLKGTEDLTDGSNVGLHEMSHALYFQKLIIERDSSRNFRKYYNRLLTACKGAYQSEISGQKNLYSPYANSDLQEFWAESAEIFFEKPHELSLQYPEVYEAIKILLNQDPLNKTCPLVEQQRSYLKNLLKF